jgi:hypothetical protein
MYAFPHSGMFKMYAEHGEKKSVKAAAGKRTGISPHQEYVGKRVAKHFEVEADDYDNIFRGKVAAVIGVEGEDPDFRIQYDDGDREDVAMDELLGE